MTEVTKDKDTKTNVFVESQTIKYALNPEAFKEDIQKAKNEIHDIYHAVDSTVNPQGKESRNVLQQLAETRQAKTILNVVGSRLEIAENQDDIAKAFEGVSEDLGYKVKVIYTDPSNSPQLIGVDKNGNPYIKDGTAYVDKKTGINYILINSESPANRTKAGVIGTIAEEQSHIIGKIEGRQKVVPDGSEKGLESLGKPTNNYFKNEFSKNDKVIGLKSDGKDYSNVDFGENVGDYISPEDLKYRKYYREEVLPYDENYQNFLRTILSMGLDVSPLGIAKGVTEAILGYDTITGEKLDLVTRTMGIIPVFDDIYKSGRSGIKLLTSTRKVEPILADGTKAIVNIDDTIKTVNKTQEIISSSGTTKVVAKETKVIDKATDITKASKNIKKVNDVSEDITKEIKIIDKSNDTGKIAKNTREMKPIKKETLDDIFTKKQEILKTSKPNIGVKDVNKNGIKVKYNKEKYIKQIEDIKLGDPNGNKTEALVNDILDEFTKKNPDFEIIDAKYGSDNGIDHMLKNKKTGELWILDSKQMSEKSITYEGGAIKLSKDGAGGNIQLSSEWINSVAGKKTLNETAKKELKKAIKTQNYKTGIVALDKKTGELIITPIEMTPEKIKK